MNKPHSVLRTLRAELSITQRELAEKAGINPVQLAQVETGLDAKSFSTAGWLAIWDAYGPTLLALGYGCDDLLRGRKKPGVKRAAA